MILDLALKKLGVSNYLDLNTEERETYKTWECALQGRKLTDEDVSMFFATETEATLEKLTKSVLGKQEDTFLKAKLDFLRKVQMFLNSPMIEKRAAEAGVARAVEAL